MLNGICNRVVKGHINEENTTDTNANGGSLEQQQHTCISSSCRLFRVSKTKSHDLTTSFEASIPFILEAVH
jgi:hypothetical protein